MACDIHFAADHPVGPGHFPGNPIIPGALILDLVIGMLPGGATGIRSAKFLHPVRPGQSLRVQWREASGQAASFECRLAACGTLVASGTIETGAPVL